MKSIKLTLSILIGLAVATWPTPAFSAVPPTAGEMAHQPIKNLFKNPGWEQGATGWARVNSGTYTTTQTAANIASGLRAGSWTPSNSLGSMARIDSAAIPIPNYALGKPGLLSCYMKADHPSVKLQITDGTNVLAGQESLEFTDTHWISGGRAVNFSLASTTGITVGMYHSSGGSGAVDYSAVVRTVPAQSVACTTSAIGAGVTGIPSTTNLVVGQHVGGAQVQNDTYITAITSNTAITLNQNGALTSTGTCTFDAAAEVTQPMTANQFSTVNSSFYTSEGVPTKVNEYNLVQVAFPFPLSGSIVPRFRAHWGATTTLYPDDCFVGLDDRLVDVSQVTFIGSAYYTVTASNAWVTASSAAYVDFGTNTNAPAPTIDSNPDPCTISTADNNLPQITVTNCPAGIYEVVAQFIGSGNTAAATSNFRLSDGTQTAGDTRSRVTASNSDYPGHTVVGYFPYSNNQTTVTWKLQGASTSGTTTIENSIGVSGSRGLSFKITRYPLSTERGMRVDQLGWRVDANISGANPSLGTASAATYKGIENSALTLVNNTGNGVIAAQIPCSSTNSPTGTTCAIGNESVGVSFNAPMAGDVEACVNFSALVRAQANQVNDPVFQIVETASNSQTVIQEGRGRIQSGAASSPTVVASIDISIGNLVCGTLTFQSPGQKTLRLFYEMPSAGTAPLILADAAAGSGQRDIHWVVRPLNYLSGALPRFSGLVTSNTSGQERMERATADSAGAISSQSGSWLTFTSRPGTGDFRYAITPGTFASTPACFCTPGAGVSGDKTCAIGNSIGPSTTLLNIFVADASTGAAANYAHQIFCMGAR